MVDIGLIVAPLVGLTKNTLLAGGAAGAGAGAGVVADGGGVSAPPQAAAMTVQSPSTTALTIFIATPFSLPRSASAVRVIGKLVDYTLLARRRCQRLRLLRPSSAA